MNTLPTSGGLINSESILPKRRATLQITAFEREIIIYDEQAHRVHALNPTGKFIWDRCDGQTSLDSLINEMLYCFSGIDRITLTNDVKSVLSSLRDEGLVEL